VVRSKATNRQFGFVWKNPFSDELHNRPDKRGMRPHSFCPHHGYPQLPRQFRRFGIEIVQNLHVIRKETKRRDDHILHFPIGKLPEVIENVRSEPRLAGRAASALED
jgi:hypothetical protein